MSKTILRMLGWTLIGFTAAFASAVQAAANVASMKGAVRIGNNAVTLNQRIVAGSTISTGPGAQVILRFDDGQQVVLNETTSFRITDFRYSESEPRSDRAVFDLLQGALRFITGIIGTRNREVVQLRVSQATIGIRGTDFMVGLVNPAYLSVISGAVSATNAAGTVVFGAGTVGTVASATSLAVTIPATALPGAIGGAFNSLAAAQVTAAVTSVGGATGAAAGGAAAPAATADLGTTALVLGVAAGVIGSAVSNTTTSHH